MNCHYCQQTCQTNFGDSWECLPCRVWYYGATQTIYVPHKDYFFAIKYTFGPCEYPTVVSQVKELSPYRYAGVLDSIELKFTKLLNLTPQNAHEKLSLYVLFS